MGQCYLLTLEFKGDFDEKAIVKKTIEFMNYRTATPDAFGLTVHFKEFPTEDMNVEQAVKKLIGDQDIGQMYWNPPGSKKAVAVANGYVAGFDGSYSFGEVVEDWFEYIATVAGEGTEFYLEPDHGHTDAIVKDGKAIFDYHYPEW